MLRPQRHDRSLTSIRNRNFMFTFLSLLKNARLTTRPQPSQQISKYKRSSSLDRSLLQIDSIALDVLSLRGILIPQTKRRKWWGLHSYPYPKNKKNKRFCTRLDFLYLPFFQFKKKSVRRFLSRVFLLLFAYYRLVKSRFLRVKRIDWTTICLF